MMKTYEVILSKLFAFKKYSWSMEIDPSIPGNDELLVEILWRLPPSILYQVTAVKG